ncbi:MAG: acyltransferase [Duganella sp.]
MGVDLFFVLSGYLIGWQVLREYAQGGKPSWRDFMIGRALRILPAYYVVLALYVAFPLGREGGDLQPLRKYITFSVNLFADWGSGRAYSHAWSLCVEEHFYLLFPVTVWLLARRPRSAYFIAVVVAIIGLGILLRAWLWHTHVAPVINAGDIEAAMRNYVSMIYNPTYVRLDGLLAGVILAAVRAFRPLWWQRVLRHPWTAGITAARPLARSAPPAR